MCNDIRGLMYSVALTALLASTGAQAADLAAPERVAASWTGFYLAGGVTAGAVVHDLNATAAIFGFPVNAGFDGVGGEGLGLTAMIGFDYQVSPRFVLGLMADINMSNVGTKITGNLAGIAGLEYDLTADLGYDILARAGVLTSPDTMLYLLGGYTYQNFAATGTVTLFGAPILSTNYDLDYHGWALGAGVETRFDDRLSLRIEYLFKQFAEERYFNDILGISPSQHTARLLLAYKFGGAALGGATPDFADSAPETWTGFYVGGSVGAGAVVHDIGATGAPVAIPASAGFDGVGAEGMLASAMIGFDYQATPHLVIGVLADVDWASINTHLYGNVGPGLAGLEYDLTGHWGYSILARAGYLATPSTLLYLLGGYSHRSFEADGVVTFLGAPILTTSYSLAYSGWTAGAGIETALTKALSARLEYRFTQYQEEKYFNNILSIAPSEHTARLAIAYKFNPF